MAFLLLPVMVVGVVVMFLVGLVQPSRSRPVQSLIQGVFSGRGE